MCDHALKVNDLQDMIKAMTQKDSESPKNNEFFNLKLDDLVQKGIEEGGSMDPTDAIALTKSKIGQMFEKGTIGYTLGDQMAKSIRQTARKLHKRQTMNA